MKSFYRYSTSIRYFLKTVEIVDIISFSFFLRDFICFFELFR